MHTMKLLAILLGVGRLGACEPAGESESNGDTATNSASQEAATWCREMAETPKADWSAAQARRFAEDCAEMVEEKAEESAEEVLEEREDPDEGGGAY